MTEKTIRDRYSNVRLWLEERIWGHRIYDESTPELALLELLNVVNAVHCGPDNSIPFSDPDLGEPRRVSYHRSLPLRTILFNNPDIAEPVRRFGANRDRWAAHRQELARRWAACRQHAGGDHLAQCFAHPDGFNYLEERLGNYEDYAAAVQALRETGIEVRSNKRWTSKFLFPFCEGARFEDLHEKKFSTDRRFFGRTGEIAYLMLARSGYGSEIWSGLQKVLFDEAANHRRRWAHVIQALTPPENAEGMDSTTSGVPIGYLPQTSHPCFTQYGEDTAAILTAEMPEYDSLSHLARLTAFHLQHYILTVAGEDQVNRPRYPIEIAGDHPDLVRRLSQRQYSANREASLGRLRREIDRWRSELKTSSSVDQLQEVGSFWSDLDKEVGATTSKNEKAVVEKVWNKLTEAGIRKHRRHLGAVHHEFCRTCGLSSATGARQYRYCPDDSLLRTLVIANVAKRMEFRELLDRWFDRYGFTIARRHAERVFNRHDLGDFATNERRLRRRLTSLGLLRVLSDDYAYVVNRYRGETV